MVASRYAHLSAEQTSSLANVAQAGTAEAGVVQASTDASTGTPGDQSYWPETDANRLRERIVSGRCIAFVGSGPSITAGYPSWTQLLRELCDATGVSCPDQLDLKPVETFLALADRCQQTSESKYCGVLSGVFACEPPEIPDSIRYLARLPFKSYVTTTFDPLLRKALEDESGKCAGVYCFPSLPVTFGNTYLFHIHGKIDVGATPDPKNVILGADAFNRAYDPKEALLWGFLQQLLSFHSCCFVGCGLREQEFQALFGTCARIREKAASTGGLGNPPEHFALLPGRDLESYASREELQRDEAKDAQVAIDLKEVGITVIRYRVLAENHLGATRFLRDCMNTSPVELRSFLNE
jgi:SIR2-like protein